MQLRTDMAKLVLALIVLVVLELCLARRGYRPSRRAQRRQHDQRRRPWRHSDSDSDKDFFDGHGGGGRGWGRRLMDRFGRGKYSFGVGPRHDPWFDVDFSWGGSSQPWWNGPNVCFSRTEDTKKADDDEKEISSHVRYQTQVCDGSDKVHKCTTTYVTPEGIETVTETYECCAGFARTPGAFGCDQEFELHDIVETIENLELDEMVKALDSVGLNEDYFLEAGSNFTVFAPTNEAFQKYLGSASIAPGITLQDMSSVMIVSEPIRETLVDNTRGLLLGHVALGSFPSTHLNDEQMIETASPFKSKIRINTYQRPVSLVTANCQKVTHVDNMATNGVVHVVDSVLTPVGDTLLNLISKNPELSTLKTALGASTMGSALREDGSLTLLAPTNTAFGKMDESLLKKLLRDQQCLDNVLKNHIFPNVICSAVIQGDVKTPNMLKKYTNLTRDSDNKLYADGAQIVNADLMATNGVLFIIDDVLLTDEALGILDLAEKQGANEFVDLVVKAGLKKELAMVENLTVFVPSNEAIQALDSKLLNDTEKLQEVLKYHVVPDIRTCSGLYNGLELDTLSGEKLRINEYSSFPFGRHWAQTAQCARIKKTDVKGCKSVIYITDKVLLPPVGNVVDVLARDPRFSTLVQLVKEAGLGDELQKDGPYTVFAPTNEVFDALGSDAVVELRDDRELLKKTILNHVAMDFVCCAGVVRTGWFRTQKIRTMSGEVFNIGRDGDDEVFVDKAGVRTCDLTATNGVVHVIDTVLMKQRRQPMSWDMDWDWY